MLEGNNIELELSLSDLPVLDGALDTLEKGIFSSLHKDNSVLSRDIINSEAFDSEPIFELLFDPQTAGGLVASVPEDLAENCITQLRESGFGQAKAIGRVAKLAAELPAIVLK